MAAVEVSLKVFRESLRKWDPGNPPQSVKVETFLTKPPKQLI